MRSSLARIQLGVILVLSLVACDGLQNAFTPRFARTGVGTRSIDLGYGPDLFYYLRHDPVLGNFSTFGTISTSGIVTDRFGVGQDFNAFTFVRPTQGYGADLFYYMRRDASNGGFATFGTFATNGTIVDRFGAGSLFDAITFAAPDLGYGTNLFYYLRHDAATGFSTFGTISTSGVVTDRFGVGTGFDALVFVAADVGYGPNLFYYLRRDPVSGFSTFGTISTSGVITDRFGVGFNFEALTFATASVGYGPNLFYYLRRDAGSGFSTFGTISTSGVISDRFGVGNNFDELAFANDPGPAIVTIDIKPGEFPNVVPPQSKGLLTVALLATASFDVATVDLLSVRFGRTGTEAALARSEVVDVNLDGLPDLSLHFMIAATGIQCGDTSATLTGQVSGGLAIRGTDSVAPANCK